jgi:Ca2+/Na+ antiporter
MSNDAHPGNALGGFGMLLTLVFGLMFTVYAADVVIQTYGFFAFISLGLAVGILLMVASKAIEVAW